ncbi:uncharacterized protein LOC132783929 [Drosophila nasuta]|uniref:uncharacterized protein LOC132783929 n=1 Tax=Drosophila nasuta TaxID=42062 RepID=UPI00295EB4B0|nr:uncharacterized protein LOC132783929 [Drosophila nasuta]
MDTQHLFVFSRIGIGNFVAEYPPIQTRALRSCLFFRCVFITGNVKQQPRRVNSESEICIFKRGRYSNGTSQNTDSGPPNRNGDTQSTALKEIDVACFTDIAST